MKLIALIFACLLAGCSGLAGDGGDRSTCWARSFGTELQEGARFVVQEPDGGYAVVGETASSISSWARWFWILELTRSGSLRSQKVYAGPGFHVSRMPDGGFLGGGLYSSISTPSYGVLELLRIGPDGAVSWHRTYDTTAWIASARPTLDGGFVVVSWASDFVLFKLGPDDSAEWLYGYGGECEDVSTSIVQAEDGSYLVAGYTDSVGDPPVGCGSDYYDAMIISLDPDGNPLWMRTYGSRPSYREVLTSVLLTRDGTIIAGGFLQRGGADGTSEILLLALDASGHVEWARSYGGEDHDTLYSMQETADGGFIVLAETHSFGRGMADFWLLRLDGAGDIVWQRSYGGSEDDVPSSVIQTAEGGYVAVGSTRSFGKGDDDVWVLALDENGHISGSCPSGIGLDTDAVATDVPITEYSRSYDRWESDLVQDDIGFTYVYESDGRSETQCRR